MHLIWHGTASIEAVCSSGRILFDPFVPLRGSDADVKIGDFDGFSDVFLTHGHLDHLVSVPELVARNPAARVYCTKTPFHTLTKKGVPTLNLRRISYGQSLRVNGFSLTVFHSRHAVLPRLNHERAAALLNAPERGNLPFLLRENRLCPEHGETVFYQIEADGKRVSLMGSLNLRDDVDYPVGADLLVLPYNGWEDNEPPAVRTIERLRPRRVVLDHYDNTFPPLTRRLDLSPILNRYAGLVSAMELGKAEEV